MAQTGSLNVLVVDDSLVIRTMLRHNLGKIGIEHISEAINGNDALKLLQSNPSISVIILDWEMPVMNGIEFMKILRSQEAFRDIYVLMHTTRADEKDVLSALSIGVNDYIVKPLDPNLFKKKLERVMAGSGGMHSSRFGDYLLRKKLITERHLEIATECQKYLDISGLTIGTLVILNGICEPLAVIEKLRPRLSSMTSVGQSPKKLLESQDFWGSLIKREQLDTILDIMANRRLNIGDVLATLGFIDADVMKTELEHFSKGKGAGSPS